MQMYTIVHPPIQEPERIQFIQRLIGTALMSADARRAVREALVWKENTLCIGRETFPVIAANRIRLVAIGKAALAMTRGAVDILGENISDGILVTKHLPDDWKGVIPGCIRCMTGGHPIPDERSMESGKAVEVFLRGARQGDLILTLISGGGSALVTLPYAGIELSDLQQLNRRLLESGADIREINVIRKHLDRIKGGGLARLAFPARVACLIISDVMGDPLDIIASGMTVADPTTYEDAWRILEKYRLTKGISNNILEFIQRGRKGETPETTKSGEACLEGVMNEIILNNASAVEGVLAEVGIAGWNSQVLEGNLKGEAREAGRRLAGILKRLAREGGSRKPICLVGGGETTVKVQGRGLGGRNLELALAAVEVLDGVRDVALVTLATDGEDGVTGYAGAVVSGDTYRIAKERGLSPSDFLAENNSSRFFEAAGGLIRTGPTGTNVNDLVFLLAW